MTRKRTPAQGRQQRRKPYDQDGRYYQYDRQEVDIGGQTFAFYVRPALGKWQESLLQALLLAEWADVPPHAQVLCLHCSHGLAGAALAARTTEGHFTLLDSHSVAVSAARRTLTANGVTHVEVMLSDCAQAVHDRRFDSVLALLPKGRAVWEQTIIDAATVLRPGGELYLAGANRGGIKTASKFVERIFGHAYVLAYKGGCRVIRAAKTEQVAPPTSDYYTWRKVSAQVDDEQFVYLTKPGLFSWKQLDDGTRLLIEALHARPLHQDDRVLDLGCGSGVLTLIAARQAHEGHVTGVDVDCRAVEATRRTLAHNQVTNVQVMQSDCGEAVRAEPFTAVVTNPPFHQERGTTYAITEQIVRDAALLLRRGGRLYMVANSFLRYRPVIEKMFGNVRILRETNKFRVWYAIKKT
jgi:16S rRNA (guanine1207-N2)-methyltransferase